MQDTAAFSRNSLRTLTALRRRIDALPILPFMLGSDNKQPFIGGGALVRALLGVDVGVEIDIDVVLPDLSIGEQLATALREHEWTRMYDPHGADAASSVSRTFETEPAWVGKWSAQADPFGLSTGPVDLIGRRFTLPMWLAHVDLTCCQVATNGRQIFFTRDALFAFITRTFRVTRETRKARIDRYVQLGFRPWGLDESVLSLPSLPGWWREDITRDEALGGDVNEFEPVDIISLPFPGVSTSESLAE